MIQGKRELLAWGLACAVAGPGGGAARAKGVQGLSLETLEGRLNLSTVAGNGAVGAEVQTQRYTTVLSLQQALGIPGTAGATQQGAATGTSTVAPSPLRRARPTRFLRDGATERLIPVEVPNLTPSPGTPAIEPAQQISVGQAAMDSLRAQLYGDDFHDDSKTIQAMVEVAYTNHLTSITLPAGTFRLTKEIRFHGTGITLSGAGNSTILDVANHHDGLGPNGWAICACVTFDPNLAMVDSAVTGDTITLRGKFDFKAGQQLFLSNGKGSAKLEEAQLGGRLTDDGEFSELGPDEYVTVASTSVDAHGNTVLKLTKSVIGTKDYFNVAPPGAVDERYLNIRAVDVPADHLTVSDLAIRFSDPAADASIFSFYTTYFTVKNVTVLDSPALHGNGAFWSDSSLYTTFENITCPQSALSLNSCRFAQILNCNASNVTMEEGTTDCLVSHNTLNTTTYVSLRTNDMTCQRDTFSYNTMHGGTKDTGAIGIWEGIDISIIGNVATGGVASVWLGLTRGTVIKGNTADIFYNFNTVDPITVVQNSWQK